MLIPTFGYIRSTKQGMNRDTFIEAHPLSQQPKDLAVRLRFSKRFYRGIVVKNVEVTVCPVDIRLFELSRCRQQDVGIIRGIGLEDLMDDREEVLAPEALDHFP